MAKTTTHADYTATALTLTTAAQPNITSLGTLTTLTVDDITINGSTISDGGDLTLDVGGDITLDAAGQQIIFATAGTNVGQIDMQGTDLEIKSLVNNADLFIRGTDGGSEITALTLDMSEAGAATFNSNVTIGTVAAGASTATPVELNLGSTFADAAGSKSKMKLKVFEDTSSNILGLGVSSGTLEFHSNQTFTFLVDESEKVRIDSSGNVGIGLTTPSDYYAPNLVVSSAGEKGITIAATATNVANYLMFADGTSGDARYRGYLGYNHASDELTLRSADFINFMSGGGSERMRIENGGNIGIGTTSPDGNLHIHDGSAGSVTAYADSHLVIETDQSNNFLSFLSPAAANQGILFGDADANWRGQIQYNHAADQMVFWSGASARMYINSNGRVGIGTSGGNSGLHVANADIRCTGAAVANDANSVSMSQESSGAFINARGAHTSARGTLGLHVSASNGGSGITALTCNNDGSVSKYSGSFKIDHPLESKKDTHHLVHSFVEGPQADNMYRGVVALENGTATINLDTVSGMTEGTFVALNTDIQCFTSNETDWDSVKGSITGNILTISCQNSSSTATVSWLVIGERQDQHMLDANWTDENGKVIVEPLKESE